jgi:hypothetical protein
MTTLRLKNPPPLRASLAERFPKLRLPPKKAAATPEPIAPVRVPDAVPPAPPQPDPETPKPEPPEPQPPPARTAPDPAFIAARTALVEELCRRWPTVFHHRGVIVPAKPLKLGIHHDVMGRWPDLDRKLLSAAMGYYCGSNGYLAALRPGAIRYDLDGQPSGEVSAEHAASAKARCKARKTRRQRASA